eukprot:409080_1
MGNSSINNAAIWPFRQETNLLLIYGYIRKIERLLPSSQIIPNDIYIIVKSYYHFSDNLLLMKYTYGFKPHMIVNPRKSELFWPTLTAISPTSHEWIPGECGLFLKP